VEQVGELRIGLEIGRPFVAIGAGDHDVVERDLQFAAQHAPQPPGCADGG
jgi:hypothetical protein